MYASMSVLSQTATYMCISFAQRWNPAIPIGIPLIFIIAFFMFILSSQYVLIHVFFLVVA